MSEKTDADYLRDMLSYAEDAQAMAENRSEGDLESDPTLRYAVPYCLLIIGEAATRISETTRNQMPQVHWKEIAGMRSWLLHDYFKIRAATVWQTVIRNLSELEKEILRFLPPEQT